VGKTPKTSSIARPLSQGSQAVSMHERARHEIVTKTRQTLRARCAAPMRGGVTELPRRARRACLARAADADTISSNRARSLVCGRGTPVARSGV